MNDLVEIKNNQVVVSSRQVAGNFNKRHDHILRDIETLKKDVPKFGEMFQESSAPDTYGRKQKIYFMNRDGFSLLVMGFTGREALKWKIKYIEAFNAMEKALRERRPLPAPQEGPSRRYTLRGAPVMISAQLEQLLHVNRSEILRRVKLHNLPFSQLTGEVLIQFKQENSIRYSTAPRMMVYAKKAVYELARMLGCMTSVQRTIETYFSTVSDGLLDIRTKIFQLYTLRSTIGYIKDWEKRRIVAEYIVDEMMRLSLWTPPAGYEGPEDALNIESPSGWSLLGAIHNSYALLRQGKDVTKENLEQYQRKINKAVGIG